MAKIMKPSLLLIGGAVCGLLAGCTSVTVQSNMDAQSVHKIQRLYVLIDNGELGKQLFSNELADGLRSVMSNSPPAMDISIVSPLDLDEKIYQAKIKDFGADAVLVIHLTTAVLDQYGGYPTLKYDASLFDQKMEKRYWRGAVDNSGGTALMNRRMREMAGVIIDRLRQNGFL